MVTWHTFVLMPNWRAHFFLCTRVLPLLLAISWFNFPLEYQWYTSDSPLKGFSQPMGLSFIRIIGRSDNRPLRRVKCKSDTFTSPKSQPLPQNPPHHTAKSLLHPSATVPLPRWPSVLQLHLTASKKGEKSCVVSVVGTFKQSNNTKTREIPHCGIKLYLYILFDLDLPNYSHVLKCTNTCNSFVIPNCNQVYGMELRSLAESFLSFISFLVFYVSRDGFWWLLVFETQW